MPSEKAYDVEQRLNVLLTGDPWHTATLQHGWTGTLRYRLSMDQRSVRLWSSGLTPGTTANATVIASLPAAYQPSGNAPVPAVCDVLAAQDPHVTVFANGDVQCFGVGTSTYFAVNGEFPLDT